MFHVRHISKILVVLISISVIRSKLSLGAKGGASTTGIVELSDSFSLNVVE